MKDWLQFISIIASFSTLIAFVGVFVKMGKEKGSQEAIQNEMRKDIDENAKDINALGSKVNQMQIENAKLITTLSNDLSWIKSSLMEIKNEISKKEN